MRTNRVTTLLALALLFTPAVTRATVAGGSPGNACFLTLEGIDANPSCEDGSSCDADGAADGICTFQFTACAYQTTDGCTPQAVTKYVVKPKRDAGGIVLPATGATSATCAASASSFQVKLKTKGKGSKRKQIATTKALTILAKAGKAKDKNTVKFRCEPAGTACPANAAGGPKQLTMSVADQASDLDNGWTGESHAFPVTPNATISLCLADCDGTSDPECTGSGAVGAGTRNGATFGAPLPLLTAGVPVCLVNAFGGDITGATANMTTGEITVPVRLRTGVHITSLNEVCPRCDGGKCSGGSNEGGSCAVDAQLKVVQSLGANKTYNLSRSCPPSGAQKAADLDILLPLLTGISSLTSAECNTTNLGTCNVAFQDLPDGCGTCVEGGCVGNSQTCATQIDDPSNPGQQICVDSKGGTNQACCSGNKAKRCFPTNGGGTLSRKGLAAVPAAGANPSVLTADEVLAGTFCIPPTGACNVDRLTGLPGLGAIILPIQTQWTK